MKKLSSIINESTDNSNIKAFTIIKPGFTSHKDEIYDYIKKKGFILIETTDKIMLPKEKAIELYKMHAKKDFYNDLCNYMTSGKLIAAYWGFDYDKHPGENTISLMKEIKNHFRDKYATSEMKNCMHSSDSLKNVIREKNILFNMN